jgi:hypothetical protein
MCSMLTGLGLFIYGLSMKWFKHMAHANADDKIVEIRDKFGMWGVGVYWTIVEMVAAQMKKGSNVPEATFKAAELYSLFGCKRNKLTSFLKHSQNVRGMIVKHSGNIIEIEIPKLLEIKDNYLSDFQVSSKSLPSIEVEKEVEKEREKKQQQQEVVVDAQFSDLEEHLNAHFGHGGRVGYAILQKYCDLGRKHGKEKLYQAIEIAGEQAIYKFSYVRGILEPKVKGDDVMSQWLKDNKA